MILRGARASRNVLVPCPLHGTRLSRGDMSLSVLTIHRRYTVVAKTVGVGRRLRSLARVCRSPHRLPPRTAALPITLCRRRVNMDFIMLIVIDLDRTWSEGHKRTERQP